MVVPLGPEDFTSLKLFLDYFFIKLFDYTLKLD
jgi:hypothetical protein